jgi:plastocyanin
MSATAWPKLVLAAAFAAAIVPAGAASAVTASPDKAKPLAITIGGLAYSTPRATVRVGDTVEWINKDIVDHNVTEKKNAIWNVSIAPGKSAKVVMKKPGSYVYYCRFHPNMVAWLDVK